MIMNSLAISFFADLDNMVWSKLLDLVPWMEELKLQVSGSLNADFMEVTLRVEKGKQGTGAVSLLVTSMYFAGCIIFKVRSSQYSTIHHIICRCQ